MAKVKRVRYDRGNLDSAINAAKRLQSDKTLYIFATYYGYTISRQKPPVTQKYVSVKPSGDVNLSK